MQESVKFILTALVIVSIISAATAMIIMKDDDEIFSFSNNYFYSFEGGMGDWVSDGTDLSDPPINWSINVSDEQAFSGNYSLRFYLENFNDAGKIWVENDYCLKPNSLYKISVSYNFGTYDYGSVNLFRIITGALNHSVSSRDDLIYQEETGRSDDTQDFVWLDKEYTFLVETNETGKIYLTIGIWGKHETTRTYYVDDLNISFKEMESADSYPDVSGNWNLSHYNFLGENTMNENVTINQTGAEISIVFSDNISCEGLIIKNELLDSPEDVDYLIYGCDFRGLGIDVIYVYNSSYMKTELPLCETCNPSVFSR